ncbi:long tail fiber protein [Acinetobacter phage vB_AbaM_Lazarus]|uniref:Long tail fiber protein n=1 Tax=Acinetobacter phage vB_AbaM_Lazarus TaxID=2686289 RepID=A0A6B9SSM0_9CAUD|nr:tail fiber protein [Acinetobacter phage vB_AbaM_Lazarus]QHJ74175.1 long tail fiber protein [Acinetobacter phage vB_AbaM_Lazarus]
MALDPNINRIKFLRSSTAGAKPTTAAIQPGEIAINLADRTLYSTDGNAIIDIGFGLGGSVNGPINATGQISTNDFLYSKYGFSVNSETADGRGISLYGNGYTASNGLPSYGLAMAATSKYGTFGAVSGSHATYLTTNSGTNRGWIFNYNGTTNVASISGTGIATFARVDAPLNGNANTATKLQSARNINGVLFDGTSDINTPAITDVVSFDNRTVKPSDVRNKAMGVYFTSKAGLNGAGDTNYGDFLSLSTYQDGTGGKVNGLYFNKLSREILHYQSDLNSNSWGTPKTIAYTDSSITGNAASATRLQTARTINGTAFDGTANINVNATYSEFIPDGANLNDYKTPGLYYCPTDAGAATQLNLPFSNAYSLFVERHAGIKQTITQYASNKTFIRKFYNGYWDNWRQLAFLDPSDQKFTENITLEKASSAATINVKTTTDNTSELVLSNRNKTASVGLVPDGTFFIWDSSRQTSFMSFTPDGVQSVLNSKLLINTPASLNSTGQETFTVTGGESSPIRFKINRAGAITTNSPVTGVSSIPHAISFNWYNTEWQIGNARDGSTGTVGFGITKGNDTLVWRHDGNSMTNYGNISNTGWISAQGDISSNGNISNTGSISTQGNISSNGNLSTAGSISGDSLITRTGRIGAPTSTYHYLDIGRDGTDITTVGQYGGAFRVVDTSNGATSFYVDSVDAKFSGKITTKPVTFYWNVTDLGNSTAAITVPDAIAPISKTGYAPFIHGSVQTDGIGYRTNVSIGAWRGSNTWTSSGAYIAIGGNDNYTTEDFRFMTGGYIGTSGGTLNILGTLNAPTLTSTTGSFTTVNTTNINAQGSIVMSAAPGGSGRSGMYTGNGDGASFSTCNIDIGSHWGLGFKDNLGNRNIIFDTRAGNASFKGSIRIGASFADETQLLPTSNQLQILTSGGQARNISTGGVLASDAYADASKVPVNGIYSKGDIKTSTWVYASKFTGPTGSGDGMFDGNASTATKLQTARTFQITGGITTNAVSFDGQQNVVLTASNVDGSKVTGVVPEAVKAQTLAVTPQKNAKLVASWKGTILQSMTPTLTIVDANTLRVRLADDSPSNRLPVLRFNVKIGTVYHLAFSDTMLPINGTVTFVQTGLTWVEVDLNSPNHGLSGSGNGVNVMAITYSAYGCYFEGSISQIIGTTGPKDSQWAYVLKLNSPTTDATYNLSGSSQDATWVADKNIWYLNPAQPVITAGAMISPDRLNFFAADTDAPTRMRSNMVTAQIWDIV